MDTKANNLATFLTKQATLFLFFTLLLFPFLIVSGDKLSLPVSVVLFICVFQAITIKTTLYHFSWEIFFVEAFGIIAVFGFFFLFIYLFIKPRTRIGDRLAIGAILTLYPPFLWAVISAIQHPKTVAFILDAIFFLLSIITLYGLVLRQKEYRS